jgi:nucleoside-diphosphate-sugar epimerase
VIDNFTYGDRGIKDLFDHPNLTLFEGDICNIKDIVHSIQGVDSVIALAAIVGDPACNLNEQETLNTNYESTKILVEIAKYYKVKRLLFASSCSVYGSNNKLELNEGSWLNPVSLYAKTRIMSEEVIFQNCGDICPIIYRLSTVYGLSTRMRFDLVVNTLTAKAFFTKKIEIFGGKQYRPNVHVQDVADAFILGLTAPRKLVFKQIINIGSNEQNYRIYDLGKIVRKVMPDVEVIHRSQKEDLRDYRINFEKAKHLLKFRPRFTVEEGINEIQHALSKKEFDDYLDDIYYNVKYLYK